MEAARAWAPARPVRLLAAVAAVAGAIVTIFWRVLEKREAFHKRLKDCLVFHSEVVVVTSAFPLDQRVMTTTKLVVLVFV